MPSTSPPIPTVSRRSAYFILALTIVVWASSFAAIRYVLQQLDPMSMTTIRLIVAALFMGAVAASFRLPLPSRQDWPRLAAAAFLGFSAYHYLLNVGTQTVPAGQASFIIATAPIWTALLAWRFLDETLSLKNGLGLLLGLGGVALMSLDQATGTITLGSLLILGAAMCAGANLVLTKDLLARTRALSVAAYSAIIGALPFVANLPWTWSASADLQWSGWLVLFYLGIVAMGIGYWLSSVALAALPANQVARALLLIPPTAALIAWLTLGETPSTMLFIAGPLILLGVWLGRRPPVADTTSS